MCMCRQGDIRRRPVVGDGPRRRVRQHGRPELGRRVAGALAAAAAPPAVLGRPHHGLEPRIPAHETTSYEDFSGA